MVLINGKDPIKRTFGGKKYTLEESSGSIQTCITRGNQFDKLGYTHRIVDKIDSSKMSGHRYLLYVSDKKRGK